MIQALLEIHKCPCLPNQFGQFLTGYDLTGSLDQGAQNLGGLRR
jgi:hypothetical protein